MKRFSIVFILTLLTITSITAAQDQCDNPRNFRALDKIVGGRLAVIDNWPGQAALRLSGPSGRRYICGGTLIADDTVLTAAHCVDGYYKSDGEWHNPEDHLVEVVLGTDDLRGVMGHHVHQVADIIIQEDYQSANKGNDIALIRLKSPASTAGARISIHRESDPNNAWVTPVMVAGFGVNQNGSGLKRFRANDGSAFFAGATRLLETTVPLADHTSCQAVYGAVAIGDGQLCAGYVEGGRDSCQGDSGGALVAFDRKGCPYQVGVVSWGAGCARENAYGVYTRVSAHASWLQASGEPSSDKPGGRGGTDRAAQRVH